MNDTELDEMLNQWEAPQAPASLRENVRRRFGAALERDRAPRRWPAWLSPSKTVWAGGALGIGAFLCIATLAIPQTFTLASPPYTVDSICKSFGRDLTPLMPNDGAVAHELDITSYNDDGKEKILSQSLPDNPFGTALLRVGSGVSSLLTNLGMRIHFTPEQLERVRTRAGFSTGFQSWFFGSAAELLRNGCASEPVVGRETILGYPTVAVHHLLGDQRRLTVWMAPNLGCFALKVKDEELQPDGSFRLLVEKQAVKVTINH